MSPEKKKIEEFKKVTREINKTWPNIGGMKKSIMDRGAHCWKRALNSLSLSLSRAGRRKKMNSRGTQVRRRTPRPTYGLYVGLYSTSKDSTQGYNTVYMAFCSPPLASQRPHDQPSTHARTQSWQLRVLPRSGTNHRRTRSSSMLIRSWRSFLSANHHIGHPCTCNPNDHAHTRD